MGAVVPHRFLVRIGHRCPRWNEMPDLDGEELFDIPASAILRNYSDLDARAPFADVRVAWNEFGLGVQLTVTGKVEDPIVDVEKPRSSDGLTLWIDTRDARASHRASRYCHQFHLLPTGGGPDRDEPAFVQTKINRALQDASLCSPSEVPIRGRRVKNGYRIEAFLAASVLTGFDPGQHPRLGVYYHLRDAELGDQYLGVNADFPFSDDPSLWDVLELTE